MFQNILSKKRETMTVDIKGRVTSIINGVASGGNCTCYMIQCPGYQFSSDNTVPNYINDNSPIMTITGIPAGYISFYSELYIIGGLGNVATSPWIGAIDKGNGSVGAALTFNDVSSIGMITGFWWFWKS